MFQTSNTIVDRALGRIRGRLVATLLLIALFAACGSSSKAPKKASTGTKNASTTAAAGPQTAAFLDIVTCDNLGGDGSASGTVENQGSSATAYRLVLGFYDNATNKLLATGSFDTATIQPGATGDWKVTASGLGSAEIVCHTVTLEKRSGGTAATTTTTSGVVATEFPCDLLSQSEIEQIAGNPLDPGDASTNHVTEETASWTARECAWAKLGASNPTEVTLAVSRAADFPSGSAKCPALPGSTTPVSGLGDRAQWSWTDTRTTLTVGKLRVCTNDTLVDVSVSGSGSGAAHLAVARGVAAKVLAAT